ncbi:MAG: hypothetical protein SVU32_08205 [Candidatus Nanohaloarchaea archaeon]|nr:hypothetical protein [Candidatus Nanohaloarchaea archaeon]
MGLFSYLFRTGNTAFVLLLPVAAISLVGYVLWRGVFSRGIRITGIVAAVIFGILSLPLRHMFWDSITR